LDRKTTPKRAKNITVAIPETMVAMVQYIL